MRIHHALVTLAIVVAASFAIALSGDARTIVLQSSDQRVAVSVVYGDLDLDSPIGAKAMLGRIQIAARQICGDHARDGVEARVEHRACVESVTQAAIAKLGRPMVASLNGWATGASSVALSASR